LNLHSSSFGAVDGGMGGGEALMVLIEICCPKVAECNFLKEMQDCDGSPKSRGELDEWS